MPRSVSKTPRRRADAPPPPRSKSGCLTCRIRRKRCDEHQDDNGGCQTCRRLNIQCLGFSTRRPEWCRDKSTLDNYKRELKKKLATRAGVRAAAARRNTIAAQLHAEYTDSSPISSSSSIGLPSSLSVPNSPALSIAQAPVLAPAFHVAASSSSLCLAEQLNEIACQLNLPYPYVSCTAQILDLARSNQLASLDQRTLTDRANSILNDLHADLQVLNTPFLDTAILDSTYGLALDQPLPLAFPPSGSGTVLSPELTWSDFGGSSAPTSPEVAALAMEQQFFSPLLYDPMNLDATIGALVQQSPMPNMAPPLPGTGLLGLSNAQCAFNSFFDPFTPTPGVATTYGPSTTLIQESPALSTLSLDDSSSSDIITAACALLLKLVVAGSRQTLVPESDEHFISIWQSLSQPNPSTAGPDAAFAACVAGCVAESQEQQQFFFQTVLTHTQGTVDDATGRRCLEAMQYAWAA